MSRILQVLALGFVLAGPMPGLAGAILEPQPAPQWEISEWINGDPGRLSEHQGRVVVLEFFQLWCPACNEFSIPLFKRWHEKYAENEDVLVLSIHTVFEGHDFQTPERLRQFVIDNGITHPVGIDAYADSNPKNPVTMGRFETGGTPQVAIIDKAGLLRFSHFGFFEFDPVEAFITRLLKEKSTVHSRPTKASIAAPPRPERPSRGPRNENRKDPRTGTYRVRLEQQDKSCGEPRPAMNFAADVKVLEDSVKVTFGRRFLGLNTLTLDFDTKSGYFEFDGREAGRERSAVLDLGLKVEGRFLPDSETGEVEFELHFDKLADSPGWECEIEAKGTGTKV